MSIDKGGDEALSHVGEAIKGIREAAAMPGIVVMLNGVAWSIKSAWMAREAADLERIAGSERLSRDDYRAWVERSDALSRESFDDGHEKLVYQAKHALGDALLDEHQGAQREALNELVSGHVSDPDAAINAAQTFGRARRDHVREHGAAALTDRWSKSLIDDGEFASKEQFYRAATGSRKKEMHRRYNAFIDGEISAIHPEAEAIKHEVAALGTAVIARALSGAGITPRQAAQVKARSLSVGKAAKGVASRSGYGARQMSQDSAELMQLIGRALPGDTNIALGSKKEVEAATGLRFAGGNGRSFHHNGRPDKIDRTRHGVVCLSGRVDKGVLFHEMGHALEGANPAVNAMASAWVRRRTEGKDAQSLASLTGLRAYKRNEVAVRDDFVDAYVGKRYAPRSGIMSNEALSMGLERLANPRQAGELALRDPDHLAMVLAAIQQEPIQ